jgi:hypothetical protein
MLGGLARRDQRVAEELYALRVINDCLLGFRPPFGTWAHGFYKHPELDDLHAQTPRRWCSFDRSYSAASIPRQASLSSSHAL